MIQAGTFLRAAACGLAAWLAVPAGAWAQDGADAAAPVARSPAPRPHASRPRPARTAAARPLTIRRRPAPAPVDVAAAPGFDDAFLVRPHGWDDPRLYRFGPFRTGGEVFYGDVAGDSITRGNAGLGQIAGYGPANGGFGGPHFDAVGGFHGGPGPDLKIDDDYAVGSLSRPDYGDVTPRYPTVKARVAALDLGATPRAAVASEPDRAKARRTAADVRGADAASEAAKARFAAPMAREAPIEAGFGDGGLPSIGLDDSPF